MNQQTAERTKHQPLHPSVRPLLDPEYVTFHDRYVQYVEPEQLNPWNPNVRTRYTWPYAGSPIGEVGSVKDIRPCENFNIRLFGPVGKPPSEGWPLVIWFHGGGFAGGNIDSDNDFCALACRSVECVVANVDYRLAPEDPFPAAVEDVAEVLRWANSDEGALEGNIDRSRIAIAGASAGGNLAAVGALMAVEMSISIAVQVLVVPVTDNTATLQTWWSSHPHAPWLTAPRMTFYRNLYLQEDGLDRDWKASPIFAPKELISRLPKTWVAIAGQDMLSTEGLEYAEMLKAAGVETQVTVYDGMPHGMMALSGKTNQKCGSRCQHVANVNAGVLSKGRRATADIIEVLQTYFHQSAS